MPSELSVYLTSRLMPGADTLRQLRRAADRAGHHHGPDHLDLAQRHHVWASRTIFRSIISRKARGHPATIF